MKGGSDLILVDDRNWVLRAMRTWESNMTSQTKMKNERRGPDIGSLTMDEVGVAPADLLVPLRAGKERKQPALRPRLNKRCG
jgi:hypothetical protein